MSDVEKIMSDIIQTTSDLFLATSKALKNKSLQIIVTICQFVANQKISFWICKHYLAETATA